MQKVAILYDASQAVMSTFDLDEVLSSILGILRDYFQMQNAGVLLIDAVTGDLVVRSDFGRIVHHKIVPKGAGITGAAVNLKRPVYSPDVSKDSRYLVGDTQTKSELAIPLIVRDEVVGVLDMQSDQTDFFDKETIDLMTLFSTQASIAIENARLYSRERRRAQQMEAINAVARQTTALVELDQLLSKVCKEMLERFPIDHISILLLEGGDLFERAHMGRLTPTVEIGSLVARTGLAGRALETSQPVLVNDVSKRAEFIRGTAEVKSELCLPLIVFGEKLGVMVLSSAQTNGFLLEDVPALESVADICAAAIQNSRHFERTKQLAYLDGLTGIFNRRFFEMRIQEEIQRAGRYETELSVVMLDLDNFKRLNDEFGHLLGDEVLRQVSVIFQNQLRKGDVCCRYGGEEFALLLPNTSTENAIEAAEKLRRTVETWVFPGVARPLTLSAGVAGFPQHGGTRDEIIAAADNALYLAKQNGRNRVMSARATAQRSAAAKD
jgi:diguanylate cyclase (GGDEF)-like protein